MFKHITIDVPDPCANCGHLIGYLYQFTREMLERLFLLKYVTVSLSTSCSCANERNRFEKQFGRLTQWDCPVTGQGAKNTKGPRWNCCTLTFTSSSPTCVTWSLRFLKVLFNQVIFPLPSPWNGGKSIRGLYLFCQLWCINSFYDGYEKVV